jgi:4-amino-4-deoxy-L-arabinose transferase-like glycosyltransferase
MKIFSNIASTHYLLIIPVSFFIIFSLIFLTVYPIAWPDEAHLGEPGYNLINSGKISSTLLKGQENNVFWIPPGYAISLAPYFGIFGYGLEQQRIFSILFGVGIIIFVYLISFRLTGNKNISLLSAFILALDPYFLRYAKFGRMEPIATFLLIAGMYLFLFALEEKSRKKLLLSGIVFGLASFVHPIPTGILFTIIIATGIFNRKELFKQLFYLIIPSVIFYAVWIFYGTTDWNNFLIQLCWQYNRVSNKELLTHTGMFFNNYRFLLFVLLFYTISFFSILKMKSVEIGTKYLAVCGILFLLIAIRTAEPQHVLYFLPFGAVTLSVFISSLRKWQSTVATTLTILIFLNCILHIGAFAKIYGFENRQSVSYSSLVEGMDKKIKNADSILLDGYPELSWYLKKYFPKISITEPPFFKEEFLISTLEKVQFVIMPRGFNVEADIQEIEGKIQKYKSVLEKYGKSLKKVDEIGNQKNWCFSVQIYQVVTK